MVKKIAVLGGGSWGTAIVKILSDSNQEVYWWMRSADSADHIKKFNHNPKYLSSVELKIPEANVSADLEYICSKADTIILATPSAFLDSVVSLLNPKYFKECNFVSAVKGIVPKHNLIVGEYLDQVHGLDLNQFAVISGPSHAEEIASEKLSYLTPASQNEKLAESLSQALSCRYVITNPSDDIYGTEYGAVLKNIYAVACGICNGLGYGDNFLAVLVSNAIIEMSRFVDVVHPINRDINESAYLGDLLVTAYSQYSRNRTFGNMIGKGYSVKFAQMEMNMIAEGYYASECMEAVNSKYEVHMPICTAVYNILYQKNSPVLEIKKLCAELK